MPGSAPNVVVEVCGPARDAFLHEPFGELLA